MKRLRDLSKLNRRAVVVIIVAAVLLITFILSTVAYRRELDSLSYGVNASVNFQPYISAFTSGSVSKNSTIQVVFTRDLAPEDGVGREASSRLLRFSPRLRGDLVWLNARTLEFTPRAPLKSDTRYQAKLAVDRLFDNVPEEAETFIFSFQTIRQQSNLDQLWYYATTDGKGVQPYVCATISTSDVATTDEILDGLTLRQGRRKLKPVVEAGDQARTFHVRAPLLHGADPVRLSFDGDALDIDQEWEQELVLPDTAQFSLSSHFLRVGKPQYFVLVFSQPLDPDQDLRGMIYAQGLADVRTRIDGNLVYVYPAGKLNRRFDFTVSGSIRSHTGSAMGENHRVSLEFSEGLPEVKFLKPGSILPATGQAQIPIRITGLRGVDVYVFEIFESNVARYFQMRSSYALGLQQVGRLVHKKTILFTQGDRAEDGVYSLDLSRLVEMRPGAIYRIGVGMRRCLSTYACAEASGDPVTDVADLKEYTGLQNPWNSTEYRWVDRDDPCTPSYYMHREVEWTDLLVSNIGLLAKRMANGRIMAYATSLSESKPQAGVSVSLLDYQLQLLGEATTDAKGAVSFDPIEGREPFLLVAQQGRQRAFLNVKGEDDLSFSTFDVSGNELSDGIQAFIYGERGVWRPGDTLHLGLIVQDRAQTLPRKHPVVFTLTNPQGQQIDRTVAPGNEYGMYRYSPAIAADARTGSYTVRAQVGGAEFAKALRIEHVKPNRLKVELGFPQQPLVCGQASSLRVESNWLHGAPAAGLRFTTRMRLSPMPNPFPQHEGYDFHDASSDFSSYQDQILDQRLNAQGVAEAMVRIPVQERAPGLLSGLFTTKVYEAGGGFSIHVASHPVSPFASYVGLRIPSSEKYFIETDRNQRFHVVAVDALGQKLANRRLSVSVFKLRWQWWWEHDQRFLASYISSDRREVVMRQDDLVTGTDGEASFQVRIDYPAYGRYLVRVRDVESGHTCSRVVYWDWPMNRERGVDRLSAESTVLALEADREAYRAGDVAQIRIPTPLEGNLLVSIENGASVLDHFWVEAQPGTTLVKVPITAEMAPNVYATVTLLQPYGQTSNDLPLRMYGTIPLMVESQDSRLRPVITAPEEVRPEEEVRISVREADGRAMSFTLAVVDEGLLDLTRFETPDPWAHFYARQALGVRTVDLYDQVIGAYAGRIQSVLKVGGGLAANDGLGEAETDPLRSRFTPVVRYFGPYHLKKGGRQTVTFTMPNYIGAVRVMAVASQIDAYGSASHRMRVRSPLMVQAVLPAQLAVRERIEVPVTVFALKEQIREVQLEVKVKGALQLEGPARRNVQFLQPGDRTVFVPVQTREQAGNGVLRIVATCGKERAESVVRIGVDNPSPRISLSQTAHVPAGQRMSLSLDSMAGMRDLQAVVEVGGMPSFSFHRWYTLHQSQEDASLEHEVTHAFLTIASPQFIRVNPEEKAEIASRVQKFIAWLPNRQTPSGGFASFPRYASPDFWLSSYVADFLHQALLAGYSVPETMLRKLKRFQQTAANEWVPECSYGNDALSQAYRLFTLAQLRVAQLGAMNRLREEKSLEPAARYALSAAYAVAGNHKTARHLLAKQSRGEGESPSHTESTRRMALHLLATVSLRDFPASGRLVERLSADFAQRDYCGTVDLGLMFMSLSRYVRGSEVSGRVAGRLKVDGKNLEVGAGDAMFSHTFRPVGAPRIEFENTGDGAAFVSLSASGRLEAFRHQATANGLELSVRYLDLHGESMPVDRLPLGAEFVAEVTVSNPGLRDDLRRLVLRYVVPSGWEVQAMPQARDGAFLSSASTSQVFRETHALTYFDLPAGKAKTFFFRLTAAYQGKFTLPATVCNALDHQTVSASTASGTTEVFQ